MEIAFFPQPIRPHTSLHGIARVLVVGIALKGICDVILQADGFAPKLFCGKENATSTQLCSILGLLMGRFTIINTVETHNHAYAECSYITNHPSHILKTLSVGGSRAGQLRLLR